jgi:ketosteroid isomerase-like protein
MSESNLDIVRRGFDAFQTMDMDAFTADWHPELLWDVHGYKDWPGTKVQYTGAPEILAEFANFMGSVRALEVTNLTIAPLESNRILATYHERRINDGEEEPVHLDIGIVYELDDGKITRIEVYTGHENARRAAGVA